LTALDKVQIGKMIRSYLLPREKLGPVEWAEKNLILSPRTTNSPGPYRTITTPYCREPLECFGRTNVRDLTLVWAAQTAKTQTILAGIAYVLDRDPAPTMWVAPSESMARSFSETRWIPLVDDCPALAAHKPNDLDKFKLLEQHYDKMSIWFVGSNSPANLASRAVRFLVMDEVDKMAEAGKRESGAVQLAEARTSTYPTALRVKTSTPTIEDGPIWIEWLKGDMRYYFVPCPHCGEFQRLVWSQVKWEGKTENGWDMIQVRNSAYYECEKCHGKISDGQKSAALRKGEWRATNPGAEPGRRSYHLSAIYSSWSTFGQLAVKFLQDRSNGLIGLQDFVNRVLAEPWVEQNEEQQTGASFGGYRMGEPAPIGSKVIVSADIQESGGWHCWVVVRAWQANAGSRLLWCGRLESWDELRSKQLEFSAPDENVFCDAADQTRSVYWNACRFGWVCLWGSDMKHFAHFTKGGRANRPFSPVSVGDPLAGKVGDTTGLTRRYARVFKWSNPTVKDMLLTLRLSGSFLVPDDVPAVYQEHITSEIKKEIRNPMTGRARVIWKQVKKQNHLLDAELMGVVGALLHGLINSDPAAIQETNLNQDSSLK